MWEEREGGDELGGEEGRGQGRCRWSAVREVREGGDEVWRGEGTIWGGGAWQRWGDVVIEESVTSWGRMGLWVYGEQGWV